LPSRCRHASLAILARSDLVFRRPPRTSPASMLQPEPEQTSARGYAMTFQIHCSRLQVQLRWALGRHTTCTRQRSIPWASRPRASAWRTSSAGSELHGARNGNDSEAEAAALAAALVLEAKAAAAAALAMSGLVTGLVAGVMARALTGMVGVLVVARVLTPVAAAVEAGAPSQCGAMQLEASADPPGRPTLPAPGADPPGRPTPLAALRARAPWAGAVTPAMVSAPAPRGRAPSPRARPP